MPPSSGQQRGRRRRRMLTAAALLTAAASPTAGELQLPSGGCGAVSLEPLDADAGYAVETVPPSLVSMMFRATCGSSPLPGLVNSNFSILEDGIAASPLEAKFEALSAPPQIAFITLLLVDMSGSVVESDGGTGFELLRTAVQQFIGSIAPPGGREQGLRLSVAAFDGRRDIQSIAFDCRERDPLLRYVADMRCGAHLCVDSASSNLYGAITQGLALLDDERGRVVAAHKESALVLFTDSRDKAGYVGESEMLQRLNGTRHRVYTVALPGDINEPVLRQVGRHGFHVAGNMSALSESFVAVGSELNRRQHGFYRIDYCATRRAGEGHNLTVKVNGGGFANSTFNADGFGPGCIPSVVRDSVLRVSQQTCGGADDDDGAVLAFLAVGIGVVAALALGGLTALAVWRHRAARSDRLQSAKGDAGSTYEAGDDVWQQSGQPATDEPGGAVALPGQSPNPATNGGSGRPERTADQSTGSASPASTGGAGGRLDPGKRAATEDSADAVGF
eukprot:TRINITY_DN3492_c13_g1_i1.p1 TRINITY_DN3492_c13_g1~~TRINITY_DN3492_c13_g1_i1.p1  ORF type:complete len:533 (+),score=191.07 TRINITY_DN3492_c13_g1_i1:87-1601(+)